MKSAEKFQNIQHNSTDYMKENMPKKQKKESRTLPKQRSMKGIRFTIWFVIGIVCVTAVLGFLRANNALSKVAATQSTIEDVKEGFSVQDYNAYSSPKMKLFGEQVVNSFITIPKDEGERKKRVETFNSYLASGLEAQSFDGVKGYRKLENQQLFDIQYGKDKATLQYKVTYTNVSITEKEVEKEVKDGEKKKKVKQKVQEEKEQVKTALLNIPVQAKKGQYAVIENLYFSAVPSVEGEGFIAISSKLPNENKVTEQQKQEVESWLNEFFTKYASAPKEEMEYIMNNPQSLEGLKEFVKISNLGVYQTESKNTFTVKAIVTFKEKEIDITNEERFTLTIKKDSGKYYVQEMKNTLGGK
ncbi:conjugal transfer protein [Rossellomorea yichunensis]|uniref:conjugal transfer protein n=1 Tax=Rossellomorea yichunensis TaxID=3077331 RepID=UPI0028DF1B6F|nr:conjugal transfer protein [Rossellomorea sp. YC4-1]MDT9027511.1 conjugal transfer protein [Rossellomorea sp. YC4-1]